MKEFLTNKRRTTVWFSLWIIFGKIPSSDSSLSSKWACSVPRGINLNWTTLFPSRFVQTIFLFIYSFFVAESTGKGPHPDKRSLRAKKENNLCCLINFRAIRRGMRWFIEQSSNFDLDLLRPTTEPNFNFLMVASWSTAARSWA